MFHILDFFVPPFLPYSWLPQKSKIHWAILELCNAHVKKSALYYPAVLRVHASWLIHFHNPITTSQLQSLIQRFIFLRPQHFSYLNNLNWSWSITLQSDWSWSFPGGSDGKETACNIGDPGSIPGSGRSPGEGHGNPLQFSCLENPTDRGVYWVMVYRVAEELGMTEVT